MRSRRRSCRRLAHCGLPVIRVDANLELDTDCVEMARCPGFWNDPVSIRDDRMSYPLEPERPTSPPIPPTPLPRLQPPNVEKPAEETPRKDSKREKAKALKRNATGDGDRVSKQDSAATRSGRVKMEETPALDTYESRR